MMSVLGVILIKRAGDGARNIKGCWDSIHVIEVQEKSTGRSAHYKLTSTVMLWLQTSRPGSGTMNLGGSLTRQVPQPDVHLFKHNTNCNCFIQLEQDGTVSEPTSHIINMGRLVEDMENKIRNTLKA